MKAVLDANVLYPATLRSLLVDLAVLKAYEAHWTALIQQEWQHNLLKNRPELPAWKLQRVEDMMNKALPTASVSDYEVAGTDINLPDPDDVHVLAVALAAGAEVIVTANLRDFPEQVLAQYGVRAISPSEFLTDLLAEQPMLVHQALQAQIERYRNPPVDMNQLLQQLAQQGAAEFTRAFQEQL